MYGKLTRRQDTAVGKESEREKNRWRTKARNNFQDLSWGLKTFPPTTFFLINDELPDVFVLYIWLEESFI